MFAKYLQHRSGFLIAFRKGFTSFHTLAIGRLEKTNIPSCLLANLRKATGIPQRDVKYGFLACPHL
ncbi:hypothetical protein D5281_03970 [bacterium 1xD42-62]|uniref:Uncharacterized protein n=1 Tax=Parablautia muri TaxID=2320879 RepID=A0A9X5BDK6_9FIRM|nr:hypothetical protein [Parablautia muri]